MPLTQAQLDKLAKNELVAKLCVEIDASSPLRYCSGDTAVTVDADLYTPRDVRGDTFKLTSPNASKARVMIDDGDLTVRTAWYSDPFSGYTVTINILLRELSENAWTTAATVAWYCDTGGFTGNIFELRLRSSYGHRKRFGLVTGNRSLFEGAPEAGETFEFSNGSTPVGQQEPMWHIATPEEIAAMNDLPDSGGSGGSLKPGGDRRGL
jgi:hypothetical protein